jgi:group I intron endonuclease
MKCIIKEKLEIPEYYFGYIYLITNEINNKKYIGQSTKINSFSSYRGSGTALRRAYKKYGINSFYKTIISFAFSKEELNQQEISYIKELNTLQPNGYNIREGGNLAGIYYKGQNNPASKTKMGSERIALKTEKVIKSLKESYKNGKVVVWNKGKNVNNCDIIKSNIEKAHTPEANKNRRKACDEYYKNHPGYTKEIADKSAKTMRESGVLKYSNHPLAKQYLVIFPDGFYKVECIAYFVKEHNMSRRVLKQNIDKGVINFNKNPSSQLSKNCFGCEIRTFENSKK